ncbi:hypothetical protein, partial [Synechococcus sp. WH 8016]|uniref:hypothetical protein n=1 Tax=Synechococcus sp. WH 8016 TaxID=166318 RepID=UPI00022D8EEA
GIAPTQPVFFAVQANESVVSGGDNIAVASSNDAGSLPIALADITRQPKQVQLLVGLLLPVTVSPLPLNTTPELKQRVMALRLQRAMVWQLIIMDSLRCLMTL